MHGRRLIRDGNSLTRLTFSEGLALGCFAPRRGPLPLVGGKEVTEANRHIAVSDPEPEADQRASRFDGPFRRQASQIRMRPNDP